MRQKGNEDFDRAEQLLKPAVLAFRMKADWETATPLYEKAAQAFRVGVLWRALHGPDAMA
jgi:hypothetical protein